MYYVSTQGVDERMINVHYDYYYYSNSFSISVLLCSDLIMMSFVCRDVIPCS